MPYTPDNKLAFFVPTPSNGDANNEGQYLALNDIIGRAPVQGLPLNGATAGYRSDGGFLQTDGAANPIWVVRRRHEILTAGWIEGLEFFNGSGPASGAIYGEAPNSNSLTVRSAFSLASDPTTMYLLYSDGGLREATYDAGGILQVRPRGGSVYTPGNDTLYEQTAFIGTTNADFFPCNQFADLIGGDDFVFYSAANLALARTKVDTAWGAVTPTVSRTNPGKRLMPGASRVLMTPPKAGRPHVALVGTSRMDGNPNRYLNPPLPDDGAFTRTLVSRGITFDRLSKGASQENVDLAKGNFLTRYRMLRRATVAIVEHIQNGIANGRTVAQVQSDFLAFCAPLLESGMIVLGVTPYPYTTSTNFWITAAGQTTINSAYEAKRKALAGWIRGTISATDLAAAGGNPSILRTQVFTDYIEAAGALESSLDSGVFADAPVLQTGTLTGGSSTTAVAASGTFVQDTLNGRLLEYAGGNYAAIVSNTDTTLYLSAMSRAGLFNGGLYDIGSTNLSPVPANGNAFRILAPMVFDGLHAVEEGRRRIDAATAITLTRVGVLS